MKGLLLFNSIEQLADDIVPRLSSQLYAEMLAAARRNFVTGIRL
jgi:hypothetical protein